MSEANVFRYWVMTRQREGEPETKVSDHASEEVAGQRADHLVLTGCHHEAWVVDKIHRQTIYTIARGKNGIISTKSEVVPTELDPVEQIRQEVMCTDNIWSAIEVLTNRLGMHAGQHLETLLYRENQNHPPV